MTLLLLRVSKMLVMDRSNELLERDALADMEGASLTIFTMPCKPLSERSLLPILLRKSRRSLSGRVSNSSLNKSLQNRLSHSQSSQDSARLRTLASRPVSGSPSDSVQRAPNRFACISISIAHSHSPPTAISLLSAQQMHGLGCDAV